MSIAPIRRSARRAGAVAGSVIAAALVLTACGPANNGGNTSADGAAPGGGAASELSGMIAGSGASSQENAALGWIAGFTEANPDVTVNYDPTGSGTGREQFLNGTVQFAGSDAALSPEELEEAGARCLGGEALELPLYISPIAIVFNLPSLGAEHVNLEPETIAGIFAGEVTNWSDPAIVAANPEIELPDLEIVPVNRSDKSGTTENFTDYLAAVAPDVWTHGPVEEWPIAGTQSGQQTSGMIDVVSAAEGTIGYADASRVGDLGTVAVGVGGQFVPLSAEAAAKVVDVSPPTEDATDLRLTIELARDTTESGSYPIVLVSYLIACSTYEDPAQAANVAAYLTYVASEAGQARAAEPDVAGSAPISADLRQKVETAISAIGAN
ncbi:phosphate ABC transporter substrate-binding protein PstS [Pseudactinotalea sp. HY160]|uniref:phosphate ABC transporter substrate-binding protein PstS n=1 Tax=Pseudactinotalea sp. HY160 TaxID=2654490 RepID=UPI00351B220D